MTEKIVQGEGYTSINYRSCCEATIEANDTFVRIGLTIEPGFHMSPCQRLEILKLLNEQLRPLREKIDAWHEGVS